jgi:hypothetical protein
MVFSTRNMHSLVILMNCGFYSLMIKREYSLIMQWEVCVMKKQGENRVCETEGTDKTEMVRLREIEKHITQRRPNATKRQ